MSASLLMGLMMTSHMEIIVGGARGDTRCEQHRGPGATQHTGSNKPICWRVLWFAVLFGIRQCRLVHDLLPTGCNKGGRVCTVTLWL